MFCKLKPCHSDILYKDVIIPVSAKSPVLNLTVVTCLNETNCINKIHISMALGSYVINTSLL